MRIETKILSSLIHNEEYTRKVAPFVDPKYFADQAEQYIAQEILKFFSKYNKPPTQDILSIEINNRTDIGQKEVSDTLELIKTLGTPATNEDWLMAKTEKFCKDRAVYNAILESIRIIDGSDTKRTQESLPSILQDALAVSFDQHIGHDYINDAESRFDFYHMVEERIPFDIDLLNKITGGGLPKKSLNVVMAGVGAGKSLFMCHVAASTLMQGRNVLYITMEMAEERIAERIDVNTMNISMDDLKIIDKKTFNTRISRIADKTRGKLIIKEYPTASAHSGHFRALIEELKMKRNFKPDLVIIHYLNICSSARMKMGASVNSYTYIKSIAEEIRGLSIEYDIPILTATQVTRGGYNSSDVELTDTSESFGLPATADLFLALINTEELDDLNQIMIKQLKNRYADPSYYKRFVVGIDKSRMKLYNVEESAQKDISDAGKQRQEDKPLFDKGAFGKNSNKFTYAGKFTYD